MKLAKKLGPEYLKVSVQGQRIASSPSRGPCRMFRMSSPSNHRWRSRCTWAGDIPGVAVRRIHGPKAPFE